MVGFPRFITCLKRHIDPVSSNNNIIYNYRIYLSFFWLYKLTSYSIFRCRGSREETNHIRSKASGDVRVNAADFSVLPRICNFSILPIQVTFGFFNDFFQKVGTKALVIFFLQHSEGEHGH